MRAVIYCRVSTKEQVENLSLGTQEKVCREYCARNDLTVEEAFIEAGESAKTANRTQLRSLLDYCQKHRGQIDAVVVYNLSRFARDNHSHHALHALLKKEGVSLRSATEPIDESSTGRFMEGVLAAVAQYDNDVRSERTRAGMTAALERGRWTFPPPLGYRKPADTSGHSLEPDPDVAPLIRQAFVLMASGDLAMTAVLRRVSAMGLRSKKGGTLAIQTLRNYLKNPLYAGWVVSPKWGIKNRGDFEPIVSDDVFQRVQSVLEGRRCHAPSRQRVHPDFPLRQFVLCSPCGSGLTASWCKGRRRRYGYYRCTRCSRGSVRKEALEGSFVRLLERLRPARAKGLETLGVRLY